MRLICVCAVVLALAGCNGANHQASGSFEYEVCYYIDTSTGGERAVVEFGDKKIPVYDTTMSEPFYKLCSEEFPDIQPKRHWVKFLNVQYRDQMQPRVPGMLPGWTIVFHLHAPYEPYSVATFREIKAAGGKAWEDTRAVLRKAFAGSDHTTPVDLCGCLVEWYRPKDGSDGPRRWTGPYNGGQNEMGKEVFDRLPVFDRPREHIITLHEKLPGLYDGSLLKPKGAKE